MKTLNLVQGSQQWIAHRFNHFNASEAAAMLGLDKKTTRTQLLHMKHTGSEKEFSDYVQENILDYGHEVEALARPLIEELIGDTFYPVTGVDGKLSASFDGLTICESIGFEHKQWNEKLADSMKEFIVPDTHMPQLQQQLMVSGAEKIIFIVSDGTEDNRVIMNVRPEQEWFERIQAGWDQFEKDLADYVPKELAEKPQASAIMQLPALSIQIKGEVIASNLPVFKSEAENFIANINTDLKTDDDFANAEANVKYCKDTEDSLEAAKKAAIAQTASIDEVMRTIDFIKDQLRTKRLDLDKKVKSEKDNIKNQIIDDAYELARNHVGDLASEIKLVKFHLVSDSICMKRDFIESTKNKRTLESLHNAVDTKLAEVKIHLDAAAKNVREKLTWLSESGNESLFPDIQQLIMKDNEDFKLILKTRIADHKEKIATAAQKKIDDDKAEEERLKQKAIDDAKVESALIEPEMIAGKPKEAMAFTGHPGKNTNQSANQNSAAIHKQSIHDEIVISLVSLGVDETTAKHIVKNVVDGKLENLTITY